MLTESLEPPTELLQQIFPWVESELVALNVWAQDNRCSKDIALRQFLKLLLWLQTILLQDGAVLYSLCPHSQLFSYQPFNTKPFQKFAVRSVAIIVHAESKAHLAYKNMPEHLVACLHGSYAELWFEQCWEQEENTDIICRHWVNNMPKLKSSFLSSLLHMPVEGVIRVCHTITIPMFIC